MQELFCNLCGKKYIPQSWNQRFCSYPCANKIGNEKAKIFYKKVTRPAIDFYRTDFLNKSYEVKQDAKHNKKS
jgi:hypothetical protein